MRLGDLQTSAQIGQWSGAGVQVAGAALSSAASTGAILSAAWVPVIGVAVVAVTLGLNAIFNRKSAKQKVIATQIVEDLEKQLQANVSAYLNGPRTEASQTYALANFDRAWAYLESEQGCGSKELGSAGQRCIEERRRGARPQWDACKNAPGGCPNWFELYRDPIELDPRVNRNPVVNALAPAASQEELAQIAEWGPIALIALGIALL